MRKLKEKHHEWENNAEQREVQKKLFGIKIKLEGKQQEWEKETSKKMKKREYKRKVKKRSETNRKEGI